MGAVGSSGLKIAATLLLALGAVPAAAGLPGSTQPGAQFVPPGNLLVIRVVPPRNAIIPGAGAAVTAPTAPPSAVFEALQGVGPSLSDTQAASVTGSVAPGSAGREIASALSGLAGPQSMSAPATAATAQGSSGMGAQIGGAVQAGVGTIASVLGNLSGAGH